METHVQGSNGTTTLAAKIFQNVFKRVFNNFDCTLPNLFTSEEPVRPHGPAPFDCGWFAKFKSLI